MEQNIPHTVGIIMDGNRRHARQKNLPALEGHRAGYMKLREVRRWAKEVGIKELIVYAFSTENWNRTKEEVGYLMNLFSEAIGVLSHEAMQEDTRVIFIGDRSMLGEDIVSAMSDVEEKTQHNGSFMFCIALSYGGRAEIIDAIHRIPRESLATVSEAEFAKLLWTKDLSDPDLIIRTSGEERLSNFLPWQSIYSELMFTKTLWPDLTKDEFLRMLSEYSARKRRLGK